MANHLFFTVRIGTDHSNSILVHFVGWLFYIFQIGTNQWLLNYHINMLSSNKLSLSSFFSQHQSLNTLWNQLHYILTTQRKFLKQKRPIWEESQRSGHLSINDTIVRSHSVRYREVSHQLFKIEGPPSLLCRISIKSTRNTSTRSSQYMSMNMQKIKIFLRQDFSSKRVSLQKPTETKSLFKI